MKRHMARIFKRLEDGICVHSDSMQMALEIKALEARIAEQEASQARRTQLVVDATLRKAGG